MPGNSKGIPVRFGRIPSDLRRGRYKIDIPITHPEAFGAEITGFADAGNTPPSNGVPPPPSPGTVRRNPAPRP